MRRVPMLTFAETAPAWRALERLKIPETFEPLPQHSWGDLIELAPEVDVVLVWTEDPTALNGSLSRLLMADRHVRAVLVVSGDHRNRPSRRPTLPERITILSVPPNARRLWHGFGRAWIDARSGRWIEEVSELAGISHLARLSVRRVLLGRIPLDLPDELDGQSLGEGEVLTPIRGVPRTWGALATSVGVSEEHLRRSAGVDLPARGRSWVTALAVVAHRVEGATWEQIALRAGYSPSGLSGLVKKECGQAPSQLTLTAAEALNTFHERLMKTLGGIRFPV